MNHTKSHPSAPHGRPLYHPETLIRHWGGGEGFRIMDALTGTLIVGATGSGKTSGPGKHLAYGYMALGMGGLVLCAKPEERHQWQQWAKETGREDDLVIIDAEGTWRFNFMEWEASRPDAGGGFSINIVALLDEVASAISGGSEGRGGDGKFWEMALHNLNSNLVDLPLLAGIPVSLPLLRDIASSAAQTVEEVNNPEWQKKSACARILMEADKATQNADAQTRADFVECDTYWKKDFPALADKTRSSIMLGFNVLIRPLVTRPLRKLFSTDSNIKPEDAFDGKIIVVDLPVQSYRLAGRIANLIWKYCFQLAVLRRVPPKDGYLRPTFLYCDECHNFVTRWDAEYQAVARSAGGCTIYMTQSRESLRRAINNNDAVDSLLANLQAKFFCQGSGETNYWASQLLGQRWIHVTSTSAGNSRSDAVLAGQPQQPNHNAGVSRSEQSRNYVDPAVFTTLKRGGPHHNFQVEAICYLGGHLFGNGSGERLPYRMLTFNQR